MLVRCPGRAALPLRTALNASRPHSITTSKSIRKPVGDREKALLATGE
ncbi:hypothetical protein [Sorangium sp. So ce1099]